MKRVRVYPYDMGSRSSQVVAQALGGLRVHPDGKYYPRPDDVVINWGMSKVPDWADAVQGNYRMINRPAAVNNAASKLESYRLFEEAGVPTIEWSTNIQVAQEWLSEGHIVLVRALDRASGGRGIVVVHPPKNNEPLPPLKRARFYAKYTPHSGEYRVHVCNGQVIDFVKKKKMTKEKIEANEYTYDKYVRNHDNGWVFAREGVELSDEIRTLSLNAVKALKLDFGAVDVIYSKKRGTFVLEVNTAPGLEGQTQESYLKALKEMCQ